MVPSSTVIHAVMKTICFFYLFKFPLSAFEVWYYLYTDDNTLSYDDVINALNYLVKEGMLVHTLEYYHLPDGENHIKIRKRHAKKSIRIFKKARFWGKIISLIPFIRMVALCNMVPLGNVSKTGDIDLFIVTKKGYLWISRALVILILKLFRLRPGDRKSQDDLFPLCPSFFVDETYLNMKELQIHSDDIYMKYWVQNVMVLYKSQKMTKDFFEQNQWVKSFLPFIEPSQVILRNKIVYSSFIEIIKSGIEYPLSLFPLEKIMFKQSKKTLPASKDSHIVIKNNIAKIHKKDRRDYFTNEWKNTYKKHIS